MQAVMLWAHFGPNGSFSDPMQKGKLQKSMDCRRNASNDVYPILVPKKQANDIMKIMKQLDRLT